MTSRISSNAVFQQAINQLLRQQSGIARTQLEISSGRRIITAKDDPIGAGVAQAIDRSLAEIERWGRNAVQVQNRLQRGEESLRQAGLNLQRAQELAVQANNAPQTRETLQGMIKELQLMRDGMVQLANSSDGTGRYLFGGTSDGTPPFVPNANGGYDYVGDQRQRRIEIGAELTVADTDPGSELFQRIRTGNGEFAVRQSGPNTGTGQLSQTGFIDPALWTRQPHTISFAENPGPPATIEWSVTEDNPPNGVIATGTYTPGEPIDFLGVRVVLTGTPADGDTFSVAPAPNSDVFDTLQRLIDTIDMPNTTPAEKTARQNAFYAVIEDLQEAGDAFVDRRAGFGARLQTVDRADDQRLAENEILRSTLSDFRDSDYAESISRLTFQLQSLEAAQQSFLRVQDLSLFNFLR